MYYRVTEADLAIIKGGIERFMVVWRKAGFSVSTKIHFLEDHAVDQMRLFGYSLGHFNEQGGESLHALVNSVKGRFGECLVHHKFRKLK